MPLFFCRYRPPPAFDPLVLFGDGTVLTTLHFLPPNVPPELPPAAVENPDRPPFPETRRWLDHYFSGRRPGFLPPYRIDNPTPFRQTVLRAVCAIPWGATATYGDIAAAVARQRGIPAMSAQAVGQAVGWNPVCLIVPCHRVVAARGALGGYGGGLRNKAALLALECPSARFRLPPRATQPRF
jgi:methylated-DNA-[protein]-cysteine S-methyltransferase